MCDSRWSTTLTRFLWLYAAMYAAFGVASPFLPAFVNARGVPPEQLGVLLGAGTAVRLLTAPLAGRLGDLRQALRVVLVVCTGLAASVTLGYLAAQGLWSLLGVSLLHAATLAPIPVVADALALGSASPPPSSGRRGFEYGWVRGAGSAAFIGGTLLAGQAVGAFGLDLIVSLQALLLMLRDEIFRQFWKSAGARNTGEWVHQKEQAERLLHLAVRTYNGLCGRGAWFYEELDDFWFTRIVFDLDVERPGVQEAVIAFATRLARDDSGRTAAGPEHARTAPPPTA